MRPIVIKDDHMPAEFEIHRGPWLLYATAFSVVLPALYVLSSGPAQCIHRTETSSFTFGTLFIKDDLSIPYRQGGIYSRWASPFRETYSPLDRLSRNSEAGGILNWYWGLFRPALHCVECRATNEKHHPQISQIFAD